MIGDGHHGDLRFWKAVAPRLGILVDELEIAQLFHRLGDRCRVKEDNGEERESHGAGTGEYERPFQTGGTLLERADEGEPLDRHERADAERMQQRAEERLAEARDGDETREKAAAVPMSANGDGEDATQMNGRTCPPSRSSVHGMMSRGEPSPS